MTAANKLLDKARECCSLASDHALADRLQVSRQLVSQWRTGKNPLSDERVAQLARLCKEDAGQWLVAIRAEQSQGDAARAWATLARRLGAAAAVGVVALLPFHSPTDAATLTADQAMHYAKWTLALALMIAAVWSRRGRFAAPLLA